MLNSNVPFSLSDIAAVLGNGDGDNNGGFGNSGFVILVIIILFAVFGWGRGGFGNDGGNGGNGGNISYVPMPSFDFGGDMQRGFDTNMIQNRFNGLERGQCDLGYENAQLIAGVTQNLMGMQNAMNQGFAGLHQGQITQGYEARLVGQATQAQMDNCCCDIKELTQQGITQGVMNTSAIQQHIQQCCCDQEKEAMQTRYDMATMGCNMQNTMHNNTRDIIENDNANWRALNERLTQMEMAQKDNKIAEQAAALASMQSKNDMLENSNYIINRLNPPAIPSYNVPNPNCCYPTQQYRGCCNNNNNCCGY